MSVLTDHAAMGDERGDMTAFTLNEKLETLSRDKLAPCPVRSYVGVVSVQVLNLPSFFLLPDICSRFSLDGWPIFT